MFTIRAIEKRDNLQLASIIRSSLEEFGANKPGTVYFDESTDHLFELFQTTPNSFYLVAECNHQLVGGVGIFPTDGLPAQTCELVKMYLSPMARGKGLGRKLIEQVIKESKAFGYQSVYLESMPELDTAIKVYERMGFERLSSPLGNSGHCGCDIWMILDIKN